MGLLAAVQVVAELRQLLASGPRFHFSQTPNVAMIVVLASVYAVLAGSAFGWTSPDVVGYVLLMVWLMVLYFLAAFESTGTARVVSSRVQAFLFPGIWREIIDGRDLRLGGLGSRKFAAHLGWGSGEGGREPGSIDLEKLEKFKVAFTEPGLLKWTWSSGYRHHDESY